MDAETMTLALRDYFLGELRGGWTLSMLGGLALALAATLWRAPTHPWRLAALPLAALGLVEVVVGLTVALRTEGQVAALLGQLALEPAAFRAAELERMAAVQRSFAWLMRVELALIAASLVLGAIFWKKRPRVRAVAAGLLLQASVVLVFDTVAASRAEHYVGALEDFETPATRSR